MTSQMSIGIDAFMLNAHMETLGEQVKRARANSGLSTTGLAAVLGVSQSTLSRIENDKFVEAPEPRVLHALAEHLGLSEPKMLQALGYVVDESLEPPKSVSPPEALALRLREARLDFDRISTIHAILEQWEMNDRRKASG